MPYEADDYLSRHFQTSGTDLARKVDELAALRLPATAPISRSTARCSSP